MVSVNNRPGDQRFLFSDLLGSEGVPLRNADTVQLPGLYLINPIDVSPRHGVH
jgi:hypothetical protein